MTIKRWKLLFLFLFLTIAGVIVVILGLKYFPFTRVVKMPAGSETAFANPETTYSQSPNTLYFDFEVAPGKEMPDGFYKGIAHSGEYSVKAYGQNSFSVAVERTAAEIGLENLDAVALSAWIYVFPTEKEVKGNLVFTASNEVGVNVCWEAVWLVEPEIPRGKWFKISKSFDLSAVVFKPGYKLQVYFWNNSSAEILVDDYFISFGGPVERRGDSTRVDMTRAGGYVPEFNHPPFPALMLQREPLGKEISPDAIGADDFAIAGDFLNTGNDNLLTVTRDGRISLFAYCTESREFRRIEVKMPPAVTPVAPVTGLMKEKFLPGKTDQLLVISEKDRILCSFAAAELPCGKAAAGTAEIKVLWKSEATAGEFIAGDFNGDGRSELLEVAGDGTWKVMVFEPDAGSGASWRVLGKNPGEPVEVWNSSRFETRITAGRFLPNKPGDVLLTVSRDKKEGRMSWSLQRLNLPGMKWEPWFGAGQGYTGKTIGPDTLNPADRFFAGAIGGGTAVFRYNRDWRYDLKQIRFNDTTFAILSRVDFQGYEKDQNPKYYESLKLIPGYFTGPATLSMVVAGQVKPSSKYQAVLPGFVHHYSIPGNK